MVLKPGMEEEAEAIFRKWGLDFAIIGKTTDTLRFVVKHGGEVMADLPIKELGDEAPVYDRPHLANTSEPEIAPHSVTAPVSTTEALLQARRLARPVARSAGSGSSTTTSSSATRCRRRAATPRSCASSTGPKGLALTTDVTPRYCEADPFEGGKQAVAEAWRNITAVGGRPLAITDNLNFGNPERPEVMGPLVGAIRGIGEACRALDFPVVSGNVSLYNETNGQGILPTPTIGGVGLLDDVTRACHARASSARATRSS